MNKNKIIFAILGAILVVLLILAAFNLRSSSDPIQQAGSSQDDVNIWIVSDEKKNFEDFLTEFKQKNPAYANKTNINVEAFSDYESYFYSLVSAFSKGQGPDIFTLNNSEQSFLEDYIIGIDPTLVSPSDFRKNYRGVFSDDLIERTGDGVEFLKGVPVGYESLGVFYNRRYFKAADFDSWTSLGSAVSSLSEKNNGDLVPLGLGTATATVLGGEIFTQLLAMSGDSGLDDIGAQSVSQALKTYESYGDQNGDNAYNSLLRDNVGKNNLDLFSLGEVAAVIGYPSTLKDIDAKGYQKTFLLGTPFPSYVGVDHKTLINYDYFVINKESKDLDFSLSVLQFMMTDDGADDYLDAFPYYLPAKISLEDDMLEEKINDDYNVVYKDFYDRDSLLTSFNIGIKQIYDREVVSILSDPTLSQSRFNSMKSSILCKAGKALTLENLSGKCD